MRTPKRTAQTLSSQHAQSLPSAQKRAEPSVKDKVEALEADICAWIESNQSLSYSKQREEIVAGLNGLNLSPAMLLELATHVLIRMGQAHFVINRERQFAPLIASGHKNLRSRRRNAAKPRCRGKIKHLAAIKKIMRKEKRKNITFKDFLLNALSRSIDDLVIEKINDTLFRVSAEEIDGINAAQNTIRDWYSEADKKMPK